MSAFEALQALAAQRVSQRESAVEVREKGMTEIITPKHILQEVMRSVLYAPPFKPFQNRTEQVMLYVAIATLVLSVLTALVFLITAWPWWGIAALIFLSFSEVSILVSFVASVVTVVRTGFPPERGWVDSVVASFDTELDVITQLQIFEKHHLEYALDRMALMVKQFRARTALVMGALDKIGIVPLAVTAYFSLRELLAKSSSTPADRPLLWGIGVALVLIYVMGLYVFQRAERLDDLCLVLKHAVEVKKSAPRREESAR
jgi:hypothetical protein